MKRLLMKRPVNIAACLLLAACLLFCAFSPAAGAIGYQGGARKVLLIVQDVKGEYDITTADGVRAYIASCDPPSEFSPAGEIDKLVAAVDRVETIFTDGTNGLRTICVYVTEGSEELTYELGLLLERNGDVLDVSTADHLYDSAGTPQIYAYGGYQPDGYAVSVLAQKVSGFRELRFDVVYNGATLEPDGMTVRCTRFQGLPFYEFGSGQFLLDAEPLPDGSGGDRGVRITVRSVGSDRIGDNEIVELFYFTFRTIKAGKMGLSVGCSMTGADGKDRILPVEARFNDKVALPYPKETAGEIADVNVNGLEFCAIRNEYFARNSERLFRRAYALYKKNTQPGLLKNDAYRQEPVFLDCGMDRFVSVIFRDGGGEQTFERDVVDENGGRRDEGTVSYGAENEKMLAQLGEPILETLYISDTTPCAVVRTDGRPETLKAILQNENVEYVDDPFRMNYADFRWGDRTGPAPEYMCTAANARKVLRFAARLADPAEIADERLAEIAGDPECVFCLYFDIDRDNKITAADARLALRMAARIDDPQEYRVDFPCEWELYQY